MNEHPARLNIQSVALLAAAIRTVPPGLPDLAPDEDLPGWHWGPGALTWP